MDDRASGHVAGELPARVTAAAAQLVGVHAGLMGSLPLAGRRILIVAQDMPYPPDHGGRVDMMRRIVALRELGAEIDIVAATRLGTDAPAVAHLATIARTVQVAQRRITPRTLLGRAPFQVASRASLRDVPLGDTYDLALLEGHYVASILDNPSLRARTLALRVHNDEVRYFESLAASSTGARRLFYRLEARRLRRFEPSLVRRMAALLCISANETQTLQARYPEARVLHLPTGRAASTTADRPTAGANVLFVGSLFMVNNREAVLWYLREVHPRLRDIRDYRLLIAGNTRGGGVGWLRESGLADDRVEIYDTPAELAPLYEGAVVFVNPMHHGAGVKLKTIEAAERGLPVVSTTVGAEGTGLRPGVDYLSADGAEAFADAVRKLLTDRALGADLVRSAQQRLPSEGGDRQALGDVMNSIFASAADRDGRSATTGTPGRGA